MAGSPSFATFAASILLLSVARTAFSYEYNNDGGNGVIHVTGKVLCQDCSQGYKEWLEGSKPIQASVVSITCFDNRHRVMYYNSDLTDASGVYDITIGSKDTNGKKIDPKACLVRLVSSPDPVCNIPTNSGGGKTGVTLGRASYVFRDVTKYTTKPFYYTTPMCDEPDTSEGDDENDGGGGGGKSKKY